MMRLTILALCGLLAPLAFAGQIYKYVGPDGRVEYSDRPIPEAQALRTSAPTADAGATASPAEAAPGDPAAASGGAEETGPYETFEIASPEADAILRSDKGDLAVGLILVPALLPGHKLHLLMDDRAVAGDLPGTQMNLSGVTLGTHQLQAQVLDDLGVPVAYTAPVTFHMRKPVPETPPPE